jgi:hypothetical protein
MTNRAIVVQTIPDAHVSIGNWGGHGHERIDKPMFINVRVREVKGPNGEPVNEGEVIDFVLGLTVPQVAQIVKLFFWDIICDAERPFFRNMFLRLLRKRWAVMTDPLSKNPTDPIFGEKAKPMQYANLDF